MPNTQTKKESMPMSISKFRILGISFLLCSCLTIKADEPSPYELQLEKTAIRPYENYLKQYPDAEKIIAGYEWSHRENKHVWAFGLRHPEHPHVRSAKEVGKFEPEDGYLWTGKNPAIDFKVIWIPGLPRGKNLVNADEAPFLRPAPGYVWETKEMKNVIWANPGHPHRNFPHIVNSEREGMFRPESGYLWADTKTWEDRFDAAPKVFEKYSKVTRRALSVADVAAGLAIAAAVQKCSKELGADIGPVMERLKSVKNQNSDRNERGTRDHSYPERGEKGHGHGPNSGHHDRL